MDARQASLSRASLERFESFREQAIEAAPAVTPQFRSLVRGWFQEDAGSTKRRRAS